MKASKCLKLMQGLLTKSKSIGGFMLRLLSMAGIVDWMWLSVLSSQVGWVINANIQSIPKYSVFTDADKQWRGSGHLEDVWTWGRVNGTNESEFFLIETGRLQVETRPLTKTSHKDEDAHLWTPYDLGLSTERRETCLLVKWWYVRHQTWVVRHTGSQWKHEVNKNFTRPLTKTSHKDAHPWNPPKLSTECQGTLLLVKWR